MNTMYFPLIKERWYDTRTKSIKHFPNSAKKLLYSAEFGFDATLCRGLWNVLRRLLEGEIHEKGRT